MTTTRTALAALAALALLARLVGGAEYEASSADEVARLSPGLKPGDAVLLKDGTWTDQQLVLSAKGSEAKPITFRARTPGMVVLTGASSVSVDGEHVAVSGLHVKDGRGGKDAIAIRGAHNRLTGCAVTGGDYKLFVHLFGRDNRVDHCYLAGKTTEGPTLQVDVPADAPNNHRIDHNHFGPRPPLGRNGGETIRVGYSHQSMNNSGTVCESNLFDRCDGEIEIISSKSCGNVYRHNTFLECAGMLTLRHGNRCVVDANFFLGRHKKGSGGVRVIGEDHVVTNNYIDAVDKGGVWVTAGVPNSELKEYFQAKNCLIAFNTIVDSAGPYLDLSAGLGSSKRTLKPEKITVANNLFSLGKGGTLSKGDEGEGWRWAGNLASGGGTDHAGAKVVDLKLERATDGLWRPSPASPTRGAAEGDFPKVGSDIDGQPRSGRIDAGCDQVSGASVVHRPLTAADVGPPWMSGRGGDRPVPPERPK